MKSTFGLASINCDNQLPVVSGFRAVPGLPNLMELFTNGAQLDKAFATDIFDCDDCSGTGVINQGQEDEHNCDKCSATGRVQCEDCDGDGKNDCPQCDGNREVECEDCGGRGQVSCPDCG